MGQSNTEVTENSQNDFADWIVGDILLTLLPVLFAILLDLLRYYVVDPVKILGDGTLVLSSFSISAPSVVRTIRMTSDKTIPRSKGIKNVGYVTLFISFINIIIYAAFKTTKTPNMKVVLPVSIACLITSSIISYIEQTLRNK